MVVLRSLIIGACETVVSSGGAMGGSPIDEYSSSVGVSQSKHEKSFRLSSDIGFESNGDEAALRGTKLAPSAGVIGVVGVVGVSAAAGAPSIARKFDSPEAVLCIHAQVGRSHMSGGVKR